MSGGDFQRLYNAASIVAVLVQVLGTALISVITYIVSRAVRRRQMQYWAIGWALYAAALTAILFAFQILPVGRGLIGAYYGLEYAAVLTICAGCRYTATDRPIGPRFAWALGGAAALALILSAVPVPFHWIFAVHTTVVGLLWVACLAELRPALKRADSGPGVRIVAVGLALLALDYLHHLPVSLVMAAGGLAASPYYYSIASLVDFMLELVLGFGNVVVILDKVRADLERANWQLKLAHDRTQDALYTDELTSAFSRYSFTATFADDVTPDGVSGSIVVADLDGLKNVNDAYGHAAGDAAIRATADGLRALVRNEDRVYRFGGDEFIVVLLGMRLAMARDRMATIDETANDCLDPTFARIGHLSVSWGVAECGGDVSVNRALATADAAMYEMKSRRKSAARRK